MYNFSKDELQFLLFGHMQDNEYGSNGRHVVIKQELIKCPLAQDGSIQFCRMYEMQRFMFISLMHTHRIMNETRNYYLM